MIPKSWILALVPQIGLAAVGSYLLTSLDNTLRARGNWVATKTLLARRAIGSEAFATSRQTLATECLDLGRWFGYQEVLVAQPVDAGRVELRFNPDPGSYLCFVYDKTPEGFSGIRFGAGPDFESLHFRADARGEFVERLPLQVDVAPGAWHGFAASFGVDELELFLDGERVFQRSRPGGREQVLGVRNGMRRVLVDDVRITDPAGRLVLEDGFFPVDRFLRVFLTASLVLLALNAVAALRVGAGASGRVGLRILVVATILLAGALAAAALYRSTFSKDYPLADMAAEEAWLREVASGVCAEIHDRHAVRAEPGVVRVLVIGSSQTWGAGATRHGESLVDFLQRELDAQGEARFECINAGISGFTGPRLLALYEAEWIDLQPDIVAINLSSNDSHPSNGDPDGTRFGAALARFVELNAERGIETLFVLEANAAEFRPDGPPHHTVMRRIAEERGVRLVDAHAHLRDRRDAGFLWWDFVHPTSLGHEWLGSLLAEAILAGERSHR